MSRVEKIITQNTELSRNNEIRTKKIMSYYVEVTG